MIRDNQETIIVVNKNVSRSSVQDFKSMNIDIIQVEENDDGLNLEQILLELGKMNITSVLVEGGSKVFTSFFRQDLWNRVSVFTAPILIGTGKEAVGDLGVFELSQAVRFKNVSIKKIGNQVLFEGSCLHFRIMEDMDVYRVS